MWYHNELIPLTAWNAVNPTRPLADNRCPFYCYGLTYKKVIYKIITLDCHQLLLLLFLQTFSCEMYSCATFGNVDELQQHQRVQHKPKGQKTRTRFPSTLTPFYFHRLVKKFQVSKSYFIFSYFSSDNVERRRGQLVARRNGYCASNMRTRMGRIRASPIYFIHKVSTKLLYGNVVHL